MSELLREAARRSITYLESLAERRVSPSVEAVTALAALDDAQQREIIQRTLLKRAGSPEDIARTVRFFATDAPYITGQLLAVDGGRSVGW